MAAHAKHSLSGSKRRYACPGSPTMEAPFPDTGNKASKDGTAMHLVAAWCLTEHRRADLRIAEMINVADEGETPEYVEFSDDMAELTQGYVDTVRALGIETLSFVEQRVDVSEITGIAEQFGTLDFGYYDKRQGEVGVTDLKTGYRFVPVEGNTQLQLYAIGLLKKLFDDGHLQPQRQEAGQAAQAQAAGVAPAVPAHADADGQPDPGVVGGGELTPGEAGQTEGEDELW